MINAPGGAPSAYCKMDGRGTRSTGRSSRRRRRVSMRRGACKNGGEWELVYFRCWGEGGSRSTSPSPHPPYSLQPSRSPVLHGPAAAVISATVRPHAPHGGHCKAIERASSGWSALRTGVIVMQGEPCTRGTPDAYFIAITTTFSPPCTTSPPQLPLCGAVWPTCCSPPHPGIAAAPARREAVLSGYCACGALVCRPGESVPHSV